MGIGDWGWGIGDGELAQTPIPNPHSPIPNPQSPNPNPQSPLNYFYIKIIIIKIFKH